VASALILGACTEPIVTKSEYPLSVAAGAPAAWCKLSITDISDARLDPDTIGMIGARTVHGPSDTRTWVGSALAGLRTYGIAVSLPADGIGPSPQGLTASVSLTKAWVASFSTTKTGSVVLHVRYAINGTPVSETNYRGAISSVDWWGSTGEVQGMLDDCLTQILGDMNRDLSSLCSSANGG
jgi:hypothetical protein